MIDSRRLNALDMPLEIEPDRQKYIFLAKKEKVDYIYNTSALEGNAMTYPEVQTLLEGITVGGHKLSDEQMILNQNESVSLLFEFLDGKRFEISKKTLFAMHERVSFREALSWGKLRDGEVNIGGTEYKPPKASVLELILDEGLEAIKRVDNVALRAIAMFLFCAKCQFFWDGNKRTGRLMMNGILLDFGYPMLNIKAKDRLEFNTKMIEWYESDDIVPTAIYLLDYYKKQTLIYR